MKKKASERKKVRRTRRARRKARPPEKTSEIQPAPEPQVQQTETVQPTVSDTEPSSG